MTSTMGNIEQTDNKTKKGGFFQRLKDLFARNDIDFDTVDANAGKQVTVLFGTQTGNAQTVAEDSVTLAKELGLDVALRDMEDVDVAMLKDVEHLLIVTSTFDNGGMPENAELLWESICDPSAPMLNTQYAVLGLGDSSYLNFCQAGKEWDARLEGLGCQRIAERVDCDVDYEASAQAWIDSVIPAIAKKYGLNADIALKNKAQHSYHHNSHNPMMAVLTKKQRLTAPDSTKEIMHYELDISGSDESYVEGDIIHIMPKNNAELVGQILAYFNEQNASDEVIQQLTHELEVRTPSMALLQIIARQTKDEALIELMQNRDIEPLEDFLWGKDSLSLMQAVKQKQADFSLSLDEFISTCQPLTARAYSISSSQSQYPTEVHITVSSVRYQSDDRQMQGVASGYLADMVDIDDTVQCYFSSNKSFKLPPEPSTPIIMVGPGTGVAPFRAFLQARQMDKTTADNWLLFGERNQATDFLYQDEIETMQASGLLTKLSLAFSRDQAEKIYVQNLMRAEGEELFAWLERGAYFYVCGDAKKMAKDVEQTLHQLIEKHGKMNEIEAMDYVDKLRKDRRYVQDVY